MSLSAFEVTLTSHRLTLRTFNGRTLFAFSIAGVLKLYDSGTPVPQLQRGTVQTICEGKQMNRSAHYVRTLLDPREHDTGSFGWPTLSLVSVSPLIGHAVSLLTSLPSR